ncbi:MAG: thioredoxin [Candidatus Eisenbacteria bacterium]|uniref:Thioredoxin n=1 Tax=Eiseniibacteriota bacterium TaxID=2212470 RepID=A0A948W408_UNCEI|nr:thioredoxin [Candidatus Eisenbacteria bacterium]MBU1947497.1 thioredoxin [Candidatus Eisenbacteria bacterium]MBU2691687.1 thioredoxin [Candidatus Eisenbacteria bacterium]
MGKIADINEADFDAEVIKSKAPVIVDLWAEWCGPCRILGPLLQEISDEFGGRVKFVKVNVDHNQALAGRFNVMSIPTLLYFNGGQPVGQTVGALPKNDILAKIEDFFKITL